MPYHSAKGATLAGLVKAPQGTALPASAKDTAAIDSLVRNMLARGEHSITLRYPKALSSSAATALTQAFTSCVKTYCEQMYNSVSCKSYSSGKVQLTFSSTARSDAQLETCREQALAAAKNVLANPTNQRAVDDALKAKPFAKPAVVMLSEHDSILDA